MCIKDRANPIGKIAGKGYWQVTLQYKQQGKDRLLNEGPYVVAHKVTYCIANLLENWELSRWWVQGLVTMPGSSVCSLSTSDVVDKQMSVCIVRY